MTLESLEVADRLLRYVQIDTQSDPYSNSFPSTEKQKNLSKILVAELQQMGIQDAAMDEYGYVMATIEATHNRKVPVVCFCAHIDTAPDCSGTLVKPILHNNYNGAPIILPDDPTQIITTDAYPYLKNFIGQSIITASGKTLLGSDDKAGVAIIMEMASYLMKNKNIEHGTIKILFTPDEEVGRGTEHLDIKKLGADFGYTLDGGELGSFEMETFSADSLVLHIQGVIAHPGAAKGILQNAIKIAADIVAALPKNEWSPEHTEGRLGFIHPNHIEGGAETARIEFLVRDFDTAMLKLHADRLYAIAQKVIAGNKDYSKAIVTMEVKEQYRNMREVIHQHPIIVEKALDAYKLVGLKPIVTPIRGGTDGSRMSFMGLPTPNIFTGMQAIHSKHEWVGVSDMEKSVELLVKLVEII
ncbi:MAG: peptidase T [Chitinophagia bacterium]|nr:peptidase T [Chitinophagia bacterium]NCA29429.1 peptidase T [Chitinophagia bacterium]NDD16936.1 peptidase T [Chitinophagia bacterium]